MVLTEVTRIPQIFFRYNSTQIQVASSLPVIRVPAYINKYIERAKKKEALKVSNLRKRITYRGDTSFPVISCTDKQYNFYLGQRYNQNYPVPLISKGWLKRHSCGQKFTIHPWDTNPSLPVLYNEKHNNEVGFPRTFAELLHDENLLQELINKGYESPTPVQVLTMPAILERKHVVLAAETGCGKTVAYIAPIIQNIRSIKQKTKLFPNTPLALIVTPGRELAEQIGAAAYDLCKNIDVNVCVLVTDGSRNEHLRLTENSDVDILVASMGIISKLVLKKFFKLTNLKHLVLDEADTLLDDSFIDGTKWLLRRIPLYISKDESISPEEGTQLIFASSTYPQDANDILAEMFEDKDDVTKIKSPYLHRVLCHVKQKFWRVDGDTRTGVLVDLAKSANEKNIPLMIFSSHAPTCDWMSYFLQDNGIPNVKFHGSLSFAHRANSLEKFSSGLCNVMCCTDLASRGLDTQHTRKTYVDYEVGSTVYAKWKDERFYPAVIIGNKSSTCIIKFTEDNVIYEVKKEFDAEEDTEHKEYNFSKNCDANSPDENVLQREKANNLMVKDAAVSSEQGNPPGVKSHQKRAWSAEEKKAVMKHLDNYILAKKLPGADAIRKCIAAEPALKHRSWKNIKDFCRNKITTMDRNVKHVVNFDFPTSVSDYILRCGRVGRVGTNQGFVTNLVNTKAGAYTVQEIEKAVRSSVRIPDVDANIKKKIQMLYHSH